MPSINVDLDYFNHPKTLRLVGLLGRGAEVLPIKLWAHCGAFNAESGKLTGYSTQEIESCLRWWGRSGELVEALVKVGFVETLEDGTFQVHDWLDHEAHLMVYRAKASAAAKARWDKARCLTHAPSMPQASSKQSQCSAVQDSKDKKTKDPGPAKPGPDPRIKILQDSFFEGLKAKLGEPPARYNGGAAGAGFKTLLQRYELDVIQSRFKPWFQSDDQFIIDNAYKIELFFGSFNRLKDGPIHKRSLTNGKSAGYAEPVSNKYAN